MSKFVLALILALSIPSRATSENSSPDHVFRDFPNLSAQSLFKARKLFSDEGLLKAYGKILESCQNWKSFPPMDRATREAAEEVLKEELFTILSPGFKLSVDSSWMARNIARKMSTMLRSKAVFGKLESPIDFRTALTFFFNYTFDVLADPNNPVLFNDLPICEIEAAGAVEEAEVFVRQFMDLRPQ